MFRRTLMLLSSRLNTLKSHKRRIGLRPVAFLHAGRGMFWNDTSFYEHSFNFILQRSCHIMLHIPYKTPQLKIQRMLALNVINCYGAVHKKAASVLFPCCSKTSHVHGSGQAGFVSVFVCIQTEDFTLNFAEKSLRLGSQYACSMAQAQRICGVVKNCTRLPKGYNIFSFEWESRDFDIACLPSFRCMWKYI